MTDDILPPNIEVRTIYLCRLCGFDVPQDTKVCPLCNSLPLPEEKPAVLSVHVKENLGAKSGIR